MAAADGGLSDAHRVAGRQAGPLLIGSEEPTDLVLLGKCSRIASAQRPADELQQAKVAGGKLIVAPLAMERQHLDRPRADPGNRTEPLPAPLVVGIVEVDPPAGDLARRPGPAPGPSRRRGPATAAGQARCRPGRPAAGSRPARCARRSSRPSVGPAQPPHGARWPRPARTRSAARRSPRRAPRRALACARREARAGASASGRSADRRRSGAGTAAGPHRPPARSASVRSRGPPQRGSPPALRTGPGRAPVVPPERATGCSPSWSRRSSTRPRRRSRPSMPLRRGSRNGPAGTTSSRTSTGPVKGPASAVCAGAAEQVNVDDEGAAADDLQALRDGRTAARGFDPAAQPAGTALGGKRSRAPVTAADESYHRSSGDERTGRSRSGSPRPDGTLRARGQRGRRRVDPGDPDLVGHLSQPVDLLGLVHAAKCNDRPRPSGPTAGPHPARPG